MKNLILVIASFFMFAFTSYANEFDEPAVEEIVPEEMASDMLSDEEGEISLLHHHDPRPRSCYSIHCPTACRYTPGCRYDRLLQPLCTRLQRLKQEGYTTWVAEIRVLS